MPLLRDNLSMLPDIHDPHDAQYWSSATLESSPPDRLVLVKLPILAQGRQPGNSNLILARVSTTNCEIPDVPTRTLVVLVRMLLN